MDRYDKAIEYLTEHPDEIELLWNAPLDQAEGCLFLYASPSGTCERSYLGNGEPCGCLTQVRRRMHAKTPELTAAIRADERLPNCDLDIRPEHLPVFAEWQRKMDAMWPGRNPESPLTVETT